MTLLNPVDLAYDQVLGSLVDAPIRDDRTGVGTRGYFGATLNYALWSQFPILTTKKVHFKSVVVELLWMLKGMTDTHYLHQHNVTIWDEWADENGQLGPIYGKQWRDWQGVPSRVHDNVFGAESIDQIKDVIHSIKTNPFSRRHIVSAWNVADLRDMALSPCHAMFQFYVSDGKLSCHLYQRSADWFLGVPFNMAQYALLTHLIARECGLGVGDLIHAFGDYHLYLNHQDQARELLTRISHGNPPQLVIDAPPEVGIFDLEPHHIRLEGYDPLPNIAAPVAV